MPYWFDKWGGKFSNEMPHFTKKKSPTEKHNALTASNIKLMAS